MASVQHPFDGAFVEPVFDSQTVFRTVMDCMARPGTIGRIDIHCEPPLPLGSVSGAIALALCDHDTPVWLTPALAKSSLREWLAFHTGAPVTDDRQVASFAFLERGAAVPAFCTFASGTQEYPDRSTTLVLELDSLEGGGTLRLSGPGIDTSREMSPVGLPANFLALWAENRPQFPRGVDLLLVAGNALLCLPRTTAIARKEA